MAFESYNNVEYKSAYSCLVVTHGFDFFGWNIPTDQVTVMVCQKEADALQDIQKEIKEFGSFEKNQSLPTSKAVIHAVAKAASYLKLFKDNEDMSLLCNTLKENTKGYIPTADSADLQFQIGNALHDVFPEKVNLPQSTRVETNHIS